MSPLLGLFVAFACMEAPAPVSREPDSSDTSDRTGSDTVEIGGETESETETPSESDTPTDPETETETASDTDSETESESETVTDSATDVETGSDTESTSETDTDSDSETDTDSVTDTDTSTDTETSSETELETETVDCNNASTLRCSGQEVHEVDACDNDLGIRRTCNERQYCSQIDVGWAACLCNDHWAGENCTECKGNWDIDSDCNACLPGFGNNEDNCSTVVRYVRWDASHGGDGLSWETAFRTIQPAIDSAHAAYWHPDNGGDPRVEVWVAAGTYYIHGSIAENLDHTQDAILLRPNVHVYGGFQGDEVHHFARDAKANLTVLSGGDAVEPDLRVQHVVVGEDKSTLDGFVITGGQSMTYGGGFINQKSPLVSNCTFVNNTSANGGAFASLDGEPRLVDCVFVNNQAISGAGGAIYADSPITIHRGVFATNTALSGGAIYNRNAGVKQISNSIFVGNASTGVEDQNGGAIKNDSETNLILTNSVIAGNISEARAGAIENVDVENVDIFNCTFVDNDARDGATAFLHSGGVMTIINTIIWNGLNAIQNENFITGSIDLSYSIIEGGSDDFTTTGQDPQFSGFPLFQGQDWDEISHSALTGQATLTDTAKRWENNSLEGKFLRPSTADQRWVYISANDLSTITVYGKVNAFVSVGDSYEIIDLVPMESSPAVDSGDGNVAPLFDLNGYWRMDRLETPDTGTGPYDLSYVDIGPYEWVNPADFVFLMPGILHSIL